MSRAMHQPFVAGRPRLPIGSAGAIAVAAIAVASAIAIVATRSSTPETPSIEPSTRAATTPSLATPRVQVDAAPPALPAVDPIGDYLAMRDDVNPKPRLRWLEDRVRDGAAPNPVDLLGQAMTDPDESVRTRAAELYERALAAH